MHQNKIWLGFLCFLSLVVLWFTCVALFHLYHFWLLNASTRPTDITWSFKELSKDRFAPYAIYKYTVKENTFTSENALNKPIFLNTYAAEEAIKEFPSKKWKVWYNSWNPEQSSLEKDFPFKECISAALLIGLLVYFIWLGFYVRKMEA